MGPWHSPRKALSTALTFAERCMLAHSGVVRCCGCRQARGSIVLQAALSSSMKGFRLAHGHIRVTVWLMVLRGRPQAGAGLARVLPLSGPGAMVTRARGLSVSGTIAALDLVTRFICKPARRQRVRLTLVYSTNAREQSITRKAWPWGDGGALGCWKMMPLAGARALQLAI